MSQTVFKVEFPDEPAHRSVVLTERGVAYQRAPKPLMATFEPSIWWAAEAPTEDEDIAESLTWRQLLATGEIRLIHDAGAADV